MILIFPVKVGIEQVRIHEDISMLDCKHGLIGEKKLL